MIALDDNMIYEHKKHPMYIHGVAFMDAAMKSKAKMSTHHDAIENWRPEEETDYTSQTTGRKPT